MVNICVFASGSGTNFENIVNKINDGTIKDAKVKLLVVNKDCYSITRANNLNVKSLLVSPKDYENKKAYEEKLISILEEEQIDLICLAGYMRILGETFVKHYEGRIINIHPSLLPKFGGVPNAIELSYEAKENKAGVTVHYVDFGVDTGTIILQEAFDFDHALSIEEFEEKIHSIEYQIYPKAINMVIERRKK